MKDGRTSERILATKPTPRATQGTRQLGPRHPGACAAAALTWRVRDVTRLRA